MSQPGGQPTRRGSSGPQAREFRDDTNLDSSTRSRGVALRESTVSHALRSEVEMLRKRLEEAQARVDQAERVAEEMHNQLKASAAEKAQVDTDPGVDDTTSLVHRLKAENRRLHADLEEARSHIFSLQPYRRDLMPEEVGRVSVCELLEPACEWLVVGGGLTNKDDVPTLGIR